MSKYFFLPIFVVFALFSSPILAPQTAVAQEDACPDGSSFCALVPIPGLTDIDQTATRVEKEVLSDFLNSLYKYVIGLAAAAAVIQIIIGGLEIAVFSRDNVGKIIDNKSRIWKAIMGLVLVFMPVLVFSVINPAILRLDINLHALDTADLQSENGNYKSKDATCAGHGECNSGYCNPASKKCAEANECYPDQDGYPNKPCPSGQSCVAPGNGQFYSCEADIVCLDEIPDGFTRPCEGVKLEDFCPVTATNNNSCFVNDFLRSAICVTQENSCQKIIGGPTQLQTL